ncbi:MAG: PorV/PorQ family protein [Gemmatimonadaceae bacterium]|nr:PorV/PorQ family protein [Gemmatimonadaceae bacterium]
MRAVAPWAVASWALAATASLALPAHARAQSGIATEGALFLLVPLGAQAIGRGQAAVASRLGPDGVWSNPAALGWTHGRELAVDHAANAFLTGDALDVAYPLGRAGVLGASALLFNFGDQGATDQFGNTIGTIYSRAMVLASSYAATFGTRVSAGVTYKFIRQSQVCSGACSNQTTFSVSTSAFDMGVHVAADSAGRLTFGAAIRNAGFGLQTIDEEQTDPLPARVHIGAEYRWDDVWRGMPGTAVRASAEVVARPGIGPASVRGGVELDLARRLFIRGGVLTESSDPSRLNGAIGLGYRQGALGIDLARSFGGAAVQGAAPPTYLTLRLGLR